MAPATTTAALLSLLCVSLGSVASSATSPPNILFILADDLGWSDVGWRNSYLHTPTLDRMAREGMILNQSYVQQSCSPSRAALMSGRYPYHLALQHDTISAPRPLHLPEDQPILPQALRDLGYATHMIGKWHLGFCNWRLTPTYRGFQSFYGYYNAAEDYYTHSTKGGYDFRDNEQVDHSATGHYSTHLFTTRALRLIQQHNTSQPFFIYLSFQAVHGPLQVPEWYAEEYCSHIADHDRKVKCGMIAAMDEAVQNVTEALQQRNLLDNTFIIFTSDNGGPVREQASNWPLRGSKITIWEGGTRAAGFVYAPRILQKKNFTYDELIHIVDWYPTLVEAAGGPSSVPNIDGVSQWNNLLGGGPGPRKEFLYNMDNVDNSSALRQGRFKLVQGYPGNPNGWFAPAEMVDKETEEIHAGRGKSPDYQLFNLNRDPEERKNILDAHQDVFEKMKARLEEYRSSLVPSKSNPRMPESDPGNFDGNWSPGWC